jgi:hypothetical protein
MARQGAPRHDAPDVDEVSTTLSAPVSAVIKRSKVGVE